MTRPFWVLWLSQVVNRFGDGFYYIALSWLLYSLTGSELALGGMFFVYMAATALAEAAGGPLTDRLSRQGLMVAMDLIRGVMTLLPFLLWRAGMLQPWHVYSVFVVNGILGTPYAPASGALLPQLVPSGDLAKANSWLLGATQAMYLTGPVVGGFVIAHFGAPHSLVVDAVSFWLSALLIALLRIPMAKSVEAPQALAAPARDSYWFALRTGWRILTSDLRLGAVVVSQSAVRVADTAFMVLMVPYVQHVLHGGAGAAGVLEASLSGGAVVASLVATRKYWDRHPLLVWSAAPVFSLATATLAIAPSLAVAVALQVIAGFSIAVFNIRAQTLFQQVVDNERLGNTLALRESVLSAVQSGGSVVAGALAAGVGVAFVFSAFGLVGAGIGVVTALYMQTAARSVKSHMPEGSIGRA